MGKLGIAQMRSIADKDTNFREVSNLVADAVRQEVDLLALPECFAFMGDSVRTSREAAEPLDGPLMHRYIEVARENRLWLSLGGFHECGADGGRIWNTHVLVDDKGEIRATYRKVHLFDVDAGSDGRFFESLTTSPGAYNGALCRNTPVGAVGLTTCYDVRFPSMYWSLRRAGADVILVPSAFMRTTGSAHWSVLLRARAVETQCYIAGAAQCGRHSADRASYGYSMIVDCWGTVAVDAGGSAESVVVAADIDRDFIARTRQRMPVQQHDRIDIEKLDLGYVNRITRSN